MSLTSAELDSLSTKLKADAGFIALHSAYPPTSGNEITTGGRKAAAWVDNGSGQITAGPLAYTGMAANQAVAAVGYWTASTAGSLLGGRALTGDATANASGAYTVDTITETGTSS